MTIPKSIIDLISQNCFMPIIDLKIPGMIPVVPGHKKHLKF